MAENVFEIHKFNYPIKLNNFEGPLDLLLHLIKTNGAKIEIKEVFISVIIEQYFECMESLNTVLDLDMASDFIDMASTLLEIKSKWLLPKNEDLSEEEDIEGDLERRLKEFAIYKEASEKLKEKEEINKFYRESKFSDNDCRLVAKDFNMNKLMDAFAGLLHKFEHLSKNEEPKKIIKERYTVAHQIKYISDIIQEKKRVSFFSLFQDDYSKIEIINTFLALLELLKRQAIHCVQNQIFEDIEIEIKNSEAFSEDMEETEFE